MVLSPHSVHTRTDNCGIMLGDLTHMSIWWTAEVNAGMEAGQWHKLRGGRTARRSSFERKLLCLAMVCTIVFLTGALPCSTYEYGTKAANKGKPNSFSAVQ